MAEVDFWGRRSAFVAEVDFWGRRSTFVAEVGDCLRDGIGRTRDVRARLVGTDQGPTGVLDSGVAFSLQGERTKKDRLFPGRLLLGLGDGRRYLRKED